MRGTNVSRLKNKKMQTNNTSGHTGVSWHKRRGCWYARISFKGKTYGLGYFDKYEDAVKARVKAEKDKFNGFLDTLKEQKEIVV